MLGPLKPRRLIEPIAVSREDLVPPQNARRKRQVWVEPRFAEAKLGHGFRRFRLRGPANVTIEGLLSAAGQNLKRFLAARGWGRPHAPCGSLVALPRQLWPLITILS